MPALDDAFLFPAPQRVEAAEGTAPADAAPQERVDPDAVERPEGCRITIRPDGVGLVGHDEAGLFYGRETLRQLRLAGESIPCGVIEDHPDLPVRGYMLDCSRDRVPSMSFLRELIPRLGRLKLNQLQLYTEHTIAYAGHEAAWRDASPFTFEELKEVEGLCAEHFIDLVPCQNLFGHLERWLNKPEYHHLAEVDDGFETAWGWRPGTCSLAPVLPGSFELSADLIDQLSAASDAELFNIGCDETFDLGQGKSKQACEQRGKAHVYLDYLQKLCARVTERGKTPIYFGDIVLEHPELVDQLPPEGVLVNWNYESTKSFGPESARFAQAGVRFWVCPGTSGWCSVTGRGRNAADNIRDAVDAGLKHGAEGCLLTEWGDHGHWQPQAVAWPGLVFGAGACWCLTTNADTETLPRAISRHAADVEDPALGDALWDLSNAYESSDARLMNSTWWFRYLQSPGLRLDEGRLTGVTAADADAGEAALTALIERLKALKGGPAEAAQLAREATFAAGLARWACRRAGERLRGAPAAVAESPDPGAVEQLEALVEEHRALWALRSRPGGLEDSVRKMEAPLRVTEAGGVRTSGNF